MIMTRYRFAPLRPVLAAGLLAAPFAALTVSPAAAQIGVGIGIGISVHIAPPALPVYVQPPLPAPGYLWTPGYWAYAEPAGYYWVPGTWVQPPSVGVLWTPPYWGFEGGVYGFHAGYWGPHVGFYGGINYGFGYGGVGFEGGEWRGGGFAYNSAVNNFGSVHVTNVYSRTVVNETNVRNVSFNGPGGVTARPTPEQLQYEHEQHVPPTSAQMQHREMASQNHALFASANGGHPAIAATARPADFKTGVVPAREAAANAAAERSDAKTERSDAKTERANARTDRTDARTDKNDVRTERNDTRTNRADQRTERADQRTSHADTAAERADTRVSHADNRAVHAAAPRPAPAHAAAPHPAARPAPAEHREEKK
jgi:hypothetical protein